MKSFQDRTGLPRKKITGLPSPSDQAVAAVSSLYDNNRMAPPALTYPQPIRGFR